jgi:hypothetical protein
MSWSVNRLLSRFPRGARLYTLPRVEDRARKVSVHLAKRQLPLSILTHLQPLDHLGEFGQLCFKRSNLRSGEVQHIFWPSEKPEIQLQEP